MAEAAITKVVQKYLLAVRQTGMHVSRAILFGSYARGDAKPDSDIDILVIAPEFDDPHTHQQINLLWQLRVHTDSRIEPLAVGERRWREDDASAILEIARREGQEILTPVVL